MPKIALLTPYVPAPAHSGGRIRIYRFAEALARHFEVHLFSAADGYEIREHLALPELAPYAALHVERKRLAVLPGGAEPARVRRVSTKALLRAFREADRVVRFDGVVAEHSYAAAPLLHSRRIPWVLDEHNVESDYAGERARAQRFRIDAINQREVAALERWEARVWQDANEVVCVSREDARRIEQVRGRPATVVPNGVCTADVPFILPSHRSGHEILFVGTLEHPPNVAAARWLAREILPRVVQLEPRARLVLCGSRPTRAVVELANERVTVTGRVPTVTPYLSRAAVYANAVRQGAGSSLKVMEALASGIPLVTTTVGVRGFDLSAPTHYAQADDTASFVRHIVECFRDPKAHDAAAARGREIAEKYSWSDLSARFVELVCRVTQEPTTEARVPVSALP